MDTITSNSTSISDLIWTHREIIKLYRDVLRGSENLEGDLRAIFERIIELSITCKEQLSHTLISKESNGSSRSSEDWGGSAIFMAGDKKTILAHCANDELALVNASSATLLTDLDEDLKNIIGGQIQEMRKLYSHIRLLHDAQ